jgi:hypothetical protein
MKASRPAANARQRNMEFLASIGVEVVDLR